MEVVEVVLLSMQVVISLLLMVGMLLILPFLVQKIDLKEIQDFEQALHQLRMQLLVEVVVLDHFLQILHIMQVNLVVMVDGVCGLI